MGDKRNTLLLLILLIIFAAIGFLAIAGLNRNETLFDMGIPFENWITIFLSIGSMIKIIYELYKK